MFAILQFKDDDESSALMQWFKKIFLKYTRSVDLFDITDLKTEYVGHKKPNSNEIVCDNVWHNK